MIGKKDNRILSAREKIVKRYAYKSEYLNTKYCWANRPFLVALTRRHWLRWTNDFETDICPSQTKDSAQIFGRRDLLEFVRCLFCRFDAGLRRGEVVFHLFCCQETGVYFGENEREIGHVWILAVHSLAKKLIGPKGRQIKWKFAVIPDIPVKL